MAQCAGALQRGPDRHLPRLYWCRSAEDLRLCEPDVVSLDLSAGAAAIAAVVSVGTTATRNAVVPVESRAETTGLSGSFGFGGSFRCQSVAQRREVG